MGIHDDRYADRSGPVYRDGDELTPRLTGSPGKSTLTSQTIAYSGMGRTAIGQTQQASSRVVQRAHVGHARPPANALAVAEQGTAGGGSPMPHADLIQRAFGLHDISTVRAFTGPTADTANRALGARAYAMGEDVVLGQNADLHTVAHEAAHVVQQRHGVDVAGGAGSPGDRYEQHADAVADRVVAGQSAAPLLDSYVFGSSATRAVQRKAVQLDHLVGADSVSSVNIVQSLAAGDNIHAMRAVARAMRQAAARRTESGGVDHVVCHGGGNSYDLMINAADADELAGSLQRRIAQLQASADAAAPATDASQAQRTSGGAGAFERGFNSEFVDILPALRQAGQTESRADTDRSAGYTEAQLRTMFTTGQRTKLMRYFGDHVIPDRLFDGDETGGCNAQQRIVLSGHILSHGTYAPGTFAQQLHARMCGHWAQLVHHYAGVTRSGGRGVSGQFDHDGQLVLGGGRSSAEYSGERQELQGDERTGNRRFRRQGMPIEEFDTIEPGDWLYIHTGVNTAGGDHSVVFSHWLDSTIQRTREGVRYRRAVTFDQSSPERGGQQHERYLGEGGFVGGHDVYPITRASRFDSDAAPPQTADDLIAGDLGVRDTGRRRAELMPQLGTGPAARRNFRYIMRMEHVHHGRLDMAALKQTIRRLNEGLIAQLGDRATEGQRSMFREANARDDLETIVRLNERLDVYVHNAEALADAEHSQSERVEPEHAEREADVAVARKGLNTEIETLTGEIERASAVVDIDAAMRDLRRESVRIRRHLIRRARRLMRARREQVRARGRRLLDAHQQRLSQINDVELPRLQTQRDRRAEVEEQGRHARGLGGRHMAIRVRRNRLSQRRDRLRRELAGLEADAGYYTAQPGSRDVFVGRRRAERGSGSRREPRATGRLENVRPELDWATLIHEGEPGSAREAQQQQRESRRARRQRRRHRRR